MKTVLLALLFAVLIVVVLFGGMYVYAGGLLEQPSRTESGYRLYDPDVLARLDFIKRAQVLGFSLDEGYES